MRSFVGVTGEVGVLGRGQNRMMAKDLLDFKQVDTGFDQVRRIAMPQAVWGALFLGRN